MNSKTLPLATVRSSQGCRQKSAPNFCEYTLKFMNHDIRYTELLDALPTNQEQLVY